MRPQHGLAAAGHPPFNVLPCRGPGIALGYRANLWLRAAVRVLQLVAQDSLDPDRPGGEVRCLLIYWSTFRLLRHRLVQG